MKSLIELLFTGDLVPNEQITVKDTKYGEFSRTISERMNALQSQLSAENFKQIEELLELRSEIGDMELTASFGYGFRLGAGLMQEISEGRKALIEKEQRR